MHGNDIKCVVDLILYFELVVGCGSLAARLCDAHRHCMVAKNRGRPETVIIAIVRIIGVVGFQENVFPIDGGFYLGKLDYLRMFDIGRYHNQQRVKRIHINIGAIIGPA